MEIRGREKTYYGTSLLVAETFKYVRFLYNLTDQNLFKAHQLVRELTDIQPDYFYEYRAVDKDGVEIPQVKDKL